MIMITPLVKYHMTFLQRELDITPVTIKARAFTDTNISDLLFHFFLAFCCCYFYLFLFFFDELFFLNRLIFAAFLLHLTLLLSFNLATLIVERIQLS